MLLLAGVLIVAGCGGQPADTAPPQPDPPATGEDTPAPSGPQEVTVKVGVIGARTGPAAELGSYLDGALSAFMALNDAGGVLSADGSTIYKFEAILRDDEANPAKSLELTEEFIFRENVVAIIGPTNTTNGLQMMPVIFENKIPLISSVATGTVMMDAAIQLAEQTGGPNYFFRTTNSDATQAEAIANYVASKGFERVAILHDNTAYGQGGIAELLPFLEAKGIEPVGVFEFAMSAPDKTPQVQQAKDAGADILVVWALGHDHAGVAVARHRLGMADVPQLGSTAIQQQIFRDLAGEAAEGALSVWPRGHVQPDGDQPVPERMQNAYDTYLKYFPDGMVLEQWGSAAYGHDAAMIIANAVAHAGTDPAKIRDAIESLAHDNVASKAIIRFSPDNHEVWRPEQFGITKVVNGRIIMTGD